MNSIRTTLCILLLTSFTNVGRSDTIILNPVQDNTIFSDSSNLSAGGGIGIFAGTNNGGNTRRGLLQFDVASGIPAGSSITSATLTLYLAQAPNGTARSIELHRLNLAWGEGTAGAGMGLSGGGFTAADGDATWTENKHNVSTWTAGSDYVAAASATSSIAGNAAGTAYTWTSASLLADVQSWLASPSGNQGWALVNAAEGTNQSIKAFSSREATDVSLRPKLSIEYTVPEPTALVAIATLAAMLFVSPIRTKHQR